MPEFKICEEFLTLRSFHGSTKRADMFCDFCASLLEVHLYPSKLLLMATYGCPAMIGKNEGVQGLVNKWREEDNFAPMAPVYFAPGKCRRQVSEDV